MVTQFIMSHSSFGKSISPPFGVAILAKTNSALETVERLKKPRKPDRGAKITNARVENVGKEQTSLMPGG